MWLQNTTGWMMLTAGINERKEEWKYRWNTTDPFKYWGMVNKISINIDNQWCWYGTIVIFHLLIFCYMSRFGLSILKFFCVQIYNNLHIFPICEQTGFSNILSYHLFLQGSKTCSTSHFMLLYKCAYSVFRYHWQLNVVAVVWILN